MIGKRNHVSTELKPDFSRSKGGDDVEFTRLDTRSNATTDRGLRVGSHLEGRALDTSSRRPDVGVHLLSFSVPTRPAARRPTTTSLAGVGTARERATDGASPADGPAVRPYLSIVPKVGRDRWARRFRHPSKIKRPAPPPPLSAFRL